MKRDTSVGEPPPVAPFTTSESPAVVDLDTADVILTLPHSAPGSFIMNRSFRQARSTTGKLAYVIFGSLEDSGVYYNWLSAKHCLSLYHSNERPDNRGYDSYEGAEEAWNFFKRTGVVPLAPFYGGVAASQHLYSTPRRAPLSPAYHVASPPAPRTPRSHTSPANRTPGPSCYIVPHAQSVQSNDQPVIHSPFFIVLVGYSPGVYTSILARNAVNPFDSHPILEASTRAEANQIYVDASMTGRVICTAIDDADEE